MYWRPAGGVPDIMWPLKTRKWSGAANQGLTTRIIVKDQVKTRIGFVSQPSGLFYIEGPFEARRGELVTALRGLGVHVRGLDAAQLATVPFVSEWRLWPGSGNRVMVYGWADVESQEEVGPAGFAYDDPDDEFDWEEPVVDAQGRPLDPVTHEVLPPHERGIFYGENGALDVGYEGWRPDVINLLVRGGQLDPATVPTRFERGMLADTYPMSTWTPGVISEPVQREDSDEDDEDDLDDDLDDEFVSVDAFAPEYRAALDADLAQACTDFATGDWERLNISTAEPYPVPSVSVSVFWAEDQDGDDVIACMLDEGATPREALGSLPAGWRTPQPGETSLTDVLCIAGLYPDADDLADGLLELCRSALMWAPAAPPALVEIELEPGDSTPAQAVRQAERRRERRFSQTVEHQSAVGDAASEQWVRENPLTFARRRTGDPFDDLIIDELNEDAEGHLMPSQWEARAGALDEWPGDLDSLLAAAARSTYTPDESSAVVSFRLLDDEDEDPDPETLMQYLQRWAAREWISGGSDVARPLIAARRLVHPRRPVVADMAKVLMLMAFLRRDADEILHRGGEWISSTSYASLASPLRPYLDALRRNGERNLAT